MVVVPLIFLALVSGITSMPDPKDFKRVGRKGLTYYLFTSAFAVSLGLLAGHFMHPGTGVTIDKESITSAVPAAAQAAPATVSEFLLHLIPTNAIQAMATDQFIQVVVFAVFFGITMNALGSKVETARRAIHESAHIVFRMIESIVKLAPLAVFGFMAWSVSTQGAEILVTLGKLIITVLVACFVQYVLFGVMIIIFARMSPIPFYKKIITSQILAFSTTSSKATLTTLMREVQEKMGVSHTSANFLLPLGACMNMDGTAIYLGICALFFSQIFGVPLEMHHYLILLLTCTIGSIGAAGIPSGSIIFMGMVLASVGIPIEGIGLLLGVDRLLDMVRTMINVTGDAAVTLIVDKSEGKLDEKVYHS
jgi:Na+/H+-dicarboxylate symporter